MFRYRIHLEELSDSETAKSLTFEVANHDDLIAIVHRARQGGLLEGDEAASTIVGLKLLSEVVLKRRQEGPFSPLLEPLGTFIKRLKSSTK